MKRMWHPWCCHTSNISYYSTFVFATLSSELSLVLLLVEYYTTNDSYKLVFCCAVLYRYFIKTVIGPILWGHSGSLCHALSLLLLSLWTLILHCHLPGVPTVTHRLCYSYSWLRLILVGSVRRLAVANGPNIFQMLLVILILTPSPHINALWITVVIRLVMIIVIVVLAIAAALKRELLAFVTGNV